MFVADLIVGQSLLADFVFAFTLADFLDRLFITKVKYIAIFLEAISKEKNV